MGGGRRMRLVLGLLGVEYYSLRCLWYLRGENNIDPAWIRITDNFPFKKDLHLNLTTGLLWKFSSSIKFSSVKVTSQVGQKISWFRKSLIFTLSYFNGLPDDFFVKCKKKFLFIPAEKHKN